MYEAGGWAGARSLAGAEGKSRLGLVTARYDLAPGGYQVGGRPIKLDERNYLVMSVSVSVFLCLTACNASCSPKKKQVVGISLGFLDMLSFWPERGRTCVSIHPN